MKYSSKTKKKNRITLFQKNKAFLSKIHKLKEEIKTRQDRIDSDPYGLFDESAHNLLKNKKNELKQVISEYKLFAKKCIAVAGAVVITGLASLGIGIGLKNSSEEPVESPVEPTTSDIQPTPEEPTSTQESQTNPEDKYTRPLAETELDFIALYQKPNLTVQEKNKLENLAFEIVESTSGLKPLVFSELNKSEIGENFFELYGEEINHTDAFIYNYNDSGNSVGAAKFNGKEKAIYNYNHEGIVLAASLLSQKQPDNVTLAANRIIATCLRNMSKDQISNIIIKGSNGKLCYNFSLDNNPALRAHVRGYLEGAIKQTEAEHTIID